MAGAALAIRLLGPVELWRDGAQLAAGGPTQRAVLAMLALRAGQPVPLDELADGIWGEGEQPAGGKGIQVHVSRLRSLLKHGRQQPLQTVPGGYRLEPDAVTLDSADFEHWLTDGQARLAAGEPQAAAENLAAGLALWRGPALMDLRDFPFATHAALRYDELRVDAAEEHIEARLALGESQGLIAELRDLIAEHPYRERLHRQLMTALYHAGQQAAALDAYTAARSRLIVDLGVEPGPELARLQQQILAHDPALAAPAPRPSDTALEPSTESRGLAHRLPTVMPLFGREALLSELEELAAAERLITLTGAGGSGKTALAITLLHRLASRYPDGAAFADLAAISRREQVLPAVAAAMGISPQAGPLADQLATIVGERRMLVVLDNCEHLLDAVPDLAPVVDATSGLIIATSRAPLGLKAERLVAVPPLAVPDEGESDLAAEPSVQLFRRAMSNVGAVLDSDELPAVATICRAVDGLPLAIELVAAQSRVRSLADLSSALHEQLPVLSARARDAPDRQRTMEAAIGWSMERLDPEQRRAFVRLAVFAGGFDARGAAAVLERDRAATLDLLTALLDASLLVRQPAAAGQARFRMLGPLRDVAWAEASPREGAASQRLHAAFMATEIDRLCPEATGIQHPEDLAQLRLEHSNLLAALQYLAETDPNHCAELLVRFEDYWDWTGRQPEARQLADALLAGGRLSNLRRCQALVVSAQIAELHGDLAEARALIDRAIGLLADVEDHATLSRVRLAETTIAGESGDIERARRAVRAAHQHARKSGVWQLYAQSLGAWAAWDEIPRYREKLEEAIQVARQRSMALTEARLQRTIGAYWQVVGHDPERARVAVRSALNLAYTFQAPVFPAHLENNLGSVAIDEGSLEEGRILLLTALRTMDRAGHRVSALFPLTGLAEIEIKTGNWENGLILMTACHALVKQLGAGGAFLESEVEKEIALAQHAEAQAGGTAAARAEAIGRQMTHREAVDFAFEINGVTPP